MRTPKTYDVNGELLTMRQMCDLAGCHKATMRTRLKIRPPAAAVAMGPADKFRPNRKPSKEAVLYPFRGQMLKPTEIVALVGVGITTVRMHLRLGRDMEAIYPIGYVPVGKRPKKPKKPKPPPKVRPTVAPKKPKTLRLDPDAPIVGRVPTPVCRPFVDARWVVGPVPSVVSPDECRPWARAATA